MYLSRKTREKASAAAQKYCPKCHKRFRRLDTHLRNSAMCKNLPPLPAPAEVTQLERPHGSPVGPCQSAILNFTPPDQSAILNFTPPTCSAKPRLKLPVAQEDWEEANRHFSTVLVPNVKHETSPESKNAVLAEGIYAFFSNKHGTKETPKRKKRQEKHAQALNRAKKCKNEARNELCQAKSSGTHTPEDVMSLARKFFQLVRAHSRCKRAYDRARGIRKARQVRHQCQHHFWPFAKRLLENTSQSDIEPQFSEEVAHQFFSETYHAEPRSFSLPHWMPSPPAPVAEFNCGEITREEISAVVSKSKTRSAPCPLDGIPYQVFKKCPALQEALHDLFNTCWMCSAVPLQWKTASVKLIGKQAAADDPTLPNNFRPIALTPCVGKLFTTIFCRRWLSFMLSNKYLDRGIQKAFMPRTPGCIEHHLKLATVGQNVRKKHRSLAVCWLDLANAYGSVHHSLITFSLQHYHAPPQFLNLIQNLYSNLAATINSSHWSSPPIPLEVGVYQGDPLSVVIFNTVINTMVDTIRTRPELGYQLTQNQSISLLQYADDTCLIANSPSSCQHLLHLVDSWLSWSGMRAKVPKCHSLALKASSGKLVDPQLHIADQRIPFAADPVKFLGKIFEVPHDPNRVKGNIVSHLLQMLDSVNSCPLTRGQKLKLYRAGIVPRLSWLLMIEDLPITWVEKKLDGLATLYVKKWAGLARPANTAILYLPHKMGGLNLPLISIQYKRLQVVKQSQLLTSTNHCTRQMAERSLQRDLTLKRAKFQPRVVVRDMMIGNPDITRKALSREAKLIVQEETYDERHKRLLDQEREDQMFRCSSSDAAGIWGRVLMELSDEHRKSAINSAVDTLPHNANLYLWWKRSDMSAPSVGTGRHWYMS